MYNIVTGTVERNVSISEEGCVALRFEARPYRSGHGENMA